MKYLKVWTSFREVISALGDAEKGRLFVSMLEYAESGKEPVAGGNERFIWPIAKMNIDMMAKANDKLRENGERGGRPTETKDNQTEPNQTKENQDEPNKTKTAHIKDKVKDKVKEKDNDNENDMCVVRGGKPRFISPTADDVRRICEMLNAKAGTNYRPGTAATQKHINARLAEGFTVNDFQIVIDKKCAEWLGTDMEKYLRPETLFGSKFESYLNAPATRAKKSSNPFEDMIREQEERMRAVEVEAEVIP